LLDRDNPVTSVAAAPSAEALAHLQALLAFETDCWDVHEATKTAEPGFVLLDVRSPELSHRGHLPGAANLPHRKTNERTLERYEPSTLFVVNCAGPHCNGADNAAVRLAGLGRPVKKMIGGIEGWKDEGFDLGVSEAE
jgi:rhodanese-related sulfurtransferase